MALYEAMFTQYSICTAQVWCPTRQPTLEALLCLTWLFLADPGN